MPPHTFQTDPQGSFVEAGKTHLSTAVFQETELKLEAVCDLTTLLGSCRAGRSPGVQAEPMAQLITPRAFVAKMTF